jgi:hypothetical protein
MTNKEMHLSNYRASFHLTVYIILPSTEKKGDAIDNLLMNYHLLWLLRMLEM